MPLLVTAVGKGAAEMTTDQGAIYATDNTAYTWTAAVQETVDATLNRTVSSGECDNKALHRLFTFCNLHWLLMRLYCSTPGGPPRGVKYQSPTTHESLKTRPQASAAPPTMRAPSPT